MTNANTLYKYDEAIFPRTFDVCGIELRPFCLGHLILLERINSPLVNETEEQFSISEGLFYFIQSLAICSLTYENGVRLLNNKEYSNEIVSYLSDEITNHIKNTPDWNFYTETNNFRLYMYYFFESMPQYKLEYKESGMKGGLDWKIGIVQIFKKLQYSDTEIFNMNLMRLFYEWCQFGESEGGLKTFNQQSIIPATIKIGE